MAGCILDILSKCFDRKVWGPKDVFSGGQVMVQQFSSVNRVCRLRGESLTGVNPVMDRQSCRELAETLSKHGCEESS